MQTELRATQWPRPEEFAILASHRFFGDISLNSRSGAGRPATRIVISTLHVSSPNGDLRPSRLGFSRSLSQNFFLAAVSMANSKNIRTSTNSGASATIAMIACQLMCVAPQADGRGIFDLTTLCLPVFAPRDFRCRNSGFYWTNAMSWTVSTFIIGDSGEAKR